MKNVKAIAGLYTARDLDQSNEFPAFSSERDRLRYMSEHYGKFDIVKAFSLYYNKNVNVSKETAENMFNVTTMELGKTVLATVKSWNKDGMEFEIPGVKEEIVTSERFDKSNLHFQQYLNQHNNQLSVEVREFKRGRWIVSVMNAYHKLWRKSIEHAIKREDGMQVHINSITRGGFLCTSPIWTLNELTGENYTVCCFIPGSQITLGIETDFDKWIGQDVVVVPQKFGTFRAKVGAPMEDSIICSRKRCLQKVGIQNLYTLYTTYNLKNKVSPDSEPQVFNAHVSGVINSNSRQGVFVEIDDKYITGMLPVPSDELLDYTPGMQLKVKIKSFDMPEGMDAFLVKNDRIIKCFVKPVFELV